MGTDGRRAAVYHTVVHPDMQGKGVGHVLVEAELDALRALGVSKAFLVAFRRNATGNAFWGRMGFSERLDITTATGRCAISSASTQRRDARTAERDPPPRREP